MLRLIRNNPTIAAGILLPLLVALFFVLATVIPRWLVAPPQYDLLFTSNDYRPAPPAIEVRFDVVQNSLRARAYNSVNNYQTVPRLYRFEHATDSVREIPVELPADGFDDGTILDIAELAGVTVSPASRAPDGYEVTNPGYRRDGLMGLLFGRRHRSGLGIRKDGAVLDIPDYNGRRFYYGNVSFVGWVLDSDD